METLRHQDGLTQLLLSSSLRSAVVHLHSSEEEGPSGSIGAVTLISGPDGRGATFSLRETRSVPFFDFKGEKHGMILDFPSIDQRCCGSSPSPSSLSFIASPWRLSGKQP